MSNLGKYGESLATSILYDKGYEIVDKNYRFGHGEIDIIATKNDVLVFIEVKTRSNTMYGEPEEAITYSKQKQLRKIANAYLHEKKIINKDCRFDVIAILLEKGNDPLINHIENAF
ncbi:MAG: UPF0102 protein [Melioribacteraceae bacterium]|nr:MAG: UPF0102 protein [Melioribacteraceae bacterium]